MTRVSSRKMILEQRAADLTSKLLDVLGITAATACLIHCLALPLLIVLAPVLSSMFRLPEEVHLTAFLSAVPASGWAMLRGYRLHGTMDPLVLGMIGLFSLGFASLGGFQWMIESGFSAIGSMILVAAHVQNWRLRKRHCVVSPSRE